MYIQYECSCTADMIHPSCHLLNQPLLRAPGVHTSAGMFLVELFDAGGRCCGGLTLGLVRTALR